MTIDKELELYGCDTDPAEFQDILQELHAVMHPAWTDENLLYEPDHAIRYCMAMRCRTKCEGLPNNFILRSLVNIRKHGKWKRKKTA